MLYGKAAGGWPTMGRQGPPRQKLPLVPPHLKVTSLTRNLDKKQRNKTCPLVTSHSARSHPVLRGGAGSDTGRSLCAAMAASLDHGKRVSPRLLCAARMWVAVARGRGREGAGGACLDGKRR